MKLYSFTGACALAPHIALEWAGADYELEMIKRSGTRDEAFLKLNPVGKVPVIEFDDREPLAHVNPILMWIANEWKDANLLPSGPDLGPDDPYPLRMWLSRFNGDIHPAFTPYFLTFRFADSEDAQKEVKAHAVEEVERLLGMVDAHLEGREWMLGDHRSILDPYLLVFCLWANFLPNKLKPFPNLAAFAKRMLADEGVQKAMKAQGMG